MKLFLNLAKLNFVIFNVLHGYGQPVQAVTFSLADVVCEQSGVGLIDQAHFQQVLVDHYHVPHGLEAQLRGGGLGVHEVVVDDERHPIVVLAEVGRGHENHPVFVVNDVIGFQKSLGQVREHRGQQRAAEHFRVQDAPGLVEIELSRLLAGEAVRVFVHLPVWSAVRAEERYRLLVVEQIDVWVQFVLQQDSCY